MDFNPKQFRQRIRQALGRLPSATDNHVEVSFSPASVRAGESYRVRIPAFAGQAIDVGYELSTAGADPLNGVVSGWCQLDSRGEAVILVPAEHPAGTVRITKVCTRNRKSWRSAWGQIEVTRIDGVRNIDKVMASPGGRKKIEPYYPSDLNELTEKRLEFSQILTATKQTPPNSVLSWYPYDTLSSLCHVEQLLQDSWAQFERSLRCGPLLDIGCGDGDLALFFASMGLPVCAIDNPPTNYNWMRGVRALQERLGYPLEIREMDVDSHFSLPAEEWGLVLLLGILYHLKNPFYMLEYLAQRSRYCILSTRIARQTMTGLPIESEPIAYLLNECEANDDPTNYWILSKQGLLRLAKRAGWRPLQWCSVGNVAGSNPVDSDADERMYLFLRSQLRSADATIRLLDGWTPISENNWVWTLRRFRFEVQLKAAMRPEGFLLGFVIPEVIAKAGPVTLTGSVNGSFCGSQTYPKHGSHTFEAQIPGEVDHTKPMAFEFFAEHNAELQPRDLGIIMPRTGAIHGISEPILFWLD